MLLISQVETETRSISKTDPKKMTESETLTSQEAISQEKTCTSTLIIDSSSDQSSSISHSSSTPSLSSLCSTSSISCLGDVTCQYEPLKISACPLEEIEGKQKQEEEFMPTIPTAAPPTRQISDDSSCVPMDDSTPRDVANTNGHMSNEDESPVSSMQGDQMDLSSLPPKEVSFEDQESSSTDAIQTTDTNSRNTSLDKKDSRVRSCLKPKQFTGLKRKRPKKEEIDPGKFSSSLPSKKFRVKLRPQVCIIPIPSRDEYSVHIKNSLWNSSEEIYSNALRNSIEFAAEGWNWRNVTEDEHMLVHSDSGELIHPGDRKSVV